ncbi:unnamed protein product [Acanthoscelides obtectus]|uniref:Myosin-VIIa n=1 Tax=Acanthoscelides obtectus TaxID=200917 RepID=A0A9P0JM39_ACAOB|nr:unnamed protein product [Acanthoscelides obtectus]CAK1673617.1 Myosin-VIIa [Acanthoscelides obtectus]
MVLVLNVQDQCLNTLREYVLFDFQIKTSAFCTSTYTGSMLIAINPYELLPIYTNALIKEYRNQNTEDLLPHIFAIGDNSYSNLKNSAKDQCIVISGESGAGKTESTKLILQYLASASGQHSWVEQQILEANPILEAFGNAKTVRNDNSSRFGKYIDIKFNKNGNIEGAKIEQYLLEKSRIVSQNEGERNYHIFYSMLAGLPKEKKKQLDLLDANNYEYLRGGKVLTCDGRNEASEFSDIMAAFKVLNFTEKEMSDIWCLLSSILHVGNIRFRSGASSHSETSEIADQGLNEKISKLLGVNKFDLTVALTKRTIYASGDQVVANLSKEFASDSRNAFAKGIYGQLFIFIVDKINSAISQVKGRGFLEKNRDSFSQDLKNLVLSSRNDLLKDIFKSEQNAKMKKTLSSQFRTSLEMLMNALNACHPFFVRCIKPNEFKKPQIFDRALCTRQLRYSGMMETAKIRQAGYPIRYSYIEFVDRFRYLAKGIPPSTKGGCRSSAENICKAVLEKRSDYQFGNTKVFLKHQDNEKLEELRRSILDSSILVLQKAIKGWICRRRYLKLRKAAIIIQKHYRARGYRSRYLVMRNGFQRLQASILSGKLRYEFNKTRNKIIKLQAVSKGYLERKHGQLGRISSIIRQRKLDEIELKTHGIKNYKFEATRLMQERLAEVNKEYAIRLKKLEEENERARKMVDQEFDFLDDTSLLIGDTETISSPVIDIPGVPIGDNKDIDLLDLQEYSFRKFAATYFISSLNYQHQKKPPKDALLQLPTPDDVLASQALYITIMRFMGDYPESNESASDNDRTPVMSKISQTIGRSFTNRKEYQEILRDEKKKLTMKKSDKQRLISMTLKRKTKLLDDVRRGLVEDTHAADTYKEWTNKRTGNLEKLHFITGHGILRTELRDEIYAIICKQLTGNHIKASYARGWVLLTLCVGCFPPSEKMINYLKAFIKTGPPGYAPYCEGKLNRTLQNGARSQPSSWLELIASKNKESISLQVSIPDGGEQIVLVDSATTSQEMLKELAASLNLKDTFGFSLFITLYDKVMSLGSEKDHVIDAISQCEQYTKELGYHEKSSPWSIFLRKEIFTPWHDPCHDPEATRLIYRQVVRGLKNGEYRCPTAADVASLIAVQYYVDNGPKMQKAVLQSRIGEYIPTYLLKQSENPSEWEIKIMAAFSNLICVREKLEAVKAMEFIVKYAHATWVILFSRFFEGMQVSGPELPKKTVIIAVNSNGIFMIDDQEQILMELSFAEVTLVTSETSPQIKVVINTVRKEEYAFVSMDAQNICNLIQYILDGLRKRSIYCVAIQDYKHPTGAESFLVLKKGDLIVLKNDLNGGKLKTATWGHGECNGKTGDFPTEAIYVLPTLEPPPADILTSFKKDGIVTDKPIAKSTVTTMQRMRMHTLASYAEEHFRAGRRLTTAQRGSMLVPARRMSKEELWKYSNEPIRQPLLQKVLTDDNASKEACRIFTAILKYMGDLPAPSARYSNEYTDEIFAGALKNDLLKDEVYCQIMKQLTFNRLSVSEERGWELLYLMTGLCIPSVNLLVELQNFLKTRTHPFVEHCLQRLQRTQKVGPRKLPPYSVEVEAIQHKSMEVFHKIYFPDDSDEAFEVDSMTRAIDLCKVIVSRLDLKSMDGFSLFVAISDRVFSIPYNTFFYDFLSELINWIRATKPSWGSAAQITANYQIFFMKKLWVNTVPERDPNADHIFHYHQELPKYLKGYHKLTKQDAINLAALILRARFEDNLQEVQSILAHSLKDIIPADIIKAASSSEWKKQIFAKYGNTPTSREHAKTEFLKIIHKWPTFGSTFFEVKQTTEPTYPEVILIAINRRGVNIIHPLTKDILATHEYPELSNWSSGNTYFHLTIGNIMKKTKLLCETSQGYKMDDLITSYTDFFRNESSKK